MVFSGAAARPHACPYFSLVHLTRFPRPTPHSTLSFRVFLHLGAPPASHSPAYPCWAALPPSPPAPAALPPSLLPVSGSGRPAMPRAKLLCLCLLSLAAAAAAARPRHLQNDLPSTPELAPRLLDAALPEIGGVEVRRVSCRRPVCRCRRKGVGGWCVAVPPPRPPALPLVDALPGLPAALAFCLPLLPQLLAKQ